jgi:hypothetical protein
MPDSRQPDDVAAYAISVRAALAHLPDAERDSLLEDLESHLAEVASESDVSLQERLGKPEDYAAELTSAFGAGTDTASTRQARPLRDRFDALLRRASGDSVDRELRALLPELRPGWWVLRAYLAVLVLAYLFRDGNVVRPIPNPFSSRGLLQIVATIVAIIISVRLGRHGAPVNRGWRRFFKAVNVATVFVALPVLVSMGTASDYIYDPSTDPYYAASAAYSPGFTNIYPYSKDGTPLKNVLLYDQDGRPMVPSTNDIVIDVPTGADGLPIPNAYPLTERNRDGDPVKPPRVALPPWMGAPSPSPTATPPP